MLSASRNAVKHAEGMTMSNSKQSILDHKTHYADSSHTTFKDVQQKKRDSVNATV